MTTSHSGAVLVGSLRKFMHAFAAWVHKTAPTP
jgi:hypothetical protein